MKTKKEKEELLRVLIVGAGNIGALYDTPKSKNVLTHAHAFSLHKNFTLVGFVDTDEAKAKKASAIWGGKAFSSIKDAFSDEQVDVAVNATPDHKHFETLKELMKLPIRFIFTEKPLTGTLSEAKEIQKLAKQKNIGIAVNYRRRFVPDFITLEKDIKNGRYGEYLSGNGYYGKGIVHNGSHIIDLLQYFIGEITSATPLIPSETKNGYDPEISYMIQFNGGKSFILQNIDYRNYTIFEVDLLFSKARLRITDSGFRIETQKVKDDKVFHGYRNMEVCAVKDTSLGMAMYFCADNIYRHLSKKEPLACSLADGCSTMSAISKIVS